MSCKMTTRQEILQAAYSRGFEKGAQAVGELGDAAAYGVDAKPALERAQYTNPGAVRRFFGAQPRLKSFELQPRYGRPYTVEELREFQRKHPRADIKATTTAPIASEYGSQGSFVKAVDAANTYRAAHPELFGTADSRGLASQLTPGLLGKPNIHLFPRDNGYLSNRPVRSNIGWTPRVDSGTGGAHFPRAYGPFSGKDSAAYNLYRSGYESPDAVGHESRHALQPYLGLLSRTYADASGNAVAWRDAPIEHEAELGRYVAGLREAGVPLTRDNLAKFISRDNRRYITNSALLDDTISRVDNDSRLSYPAYSGKNVFTPDASMYPSALYADTQYAHAKAVRDHDRASAAYPDARANFDFRRGIQDDNMAAYKRDLTRYEARPKLLRRFYDKPEAPVFNISAPVAPGPAPTMKPLRDSIGRVYDAPYGAPAANEHLFPRGELGSDAEQRIEKLIQRAPGFVQNQSRNDQLKEAYARGFEKGAQTNNTVYNTTSSPVPAAAPLSPSYPSRFDTPESVARNQEASARHEALFNKHYTPAQRENAAQQEAFADAESSRAHAASIAARQAEVNRRAGAIGAGVRAVEPGYNIARDVFLTGMTLPLQGAAALGWARKANLARKALPLAMAAQPLIDPTIRGARALNAAHDATGVTRRQIAGDVAGLAWQGRPWGGNDLDRALRGEVAHAAVARPQQASALNQVANYFNPVAGVANIAGRIAAPRIEQATRGSLMGYLTGGKTQADIADDVQGSRVAQYFATKSQADPDYARRMAAYGGSAGAAYAQQLLGMEPTGRIEDLSGVPDAAKRIYENPDMPAILKQQLLEQLPGAEAYARDALYAGAATSVPAAIGSAVLRTPQTVADLQEAQGRIAAGYSGAMNPTNSITSRVQHGADAVRAGVDAATSAGRTYGPLATHAQAEIAKRKAQQIAQ